MKFSTVQVLLTSSEDNLPRSVPEILPFISTIRGHAPLASWFVKTVEILCENCNDPSFDIIKIRTYGAIIALKFIQTVISRTIVRQIPLCSYRGSAIQLHRGW
jgi:hypothetical protein